MRLQWTLGAALLLATLPAGNQSLAAGNDSGHLAALAARQDLCDMICYAKASGQVSPLMRVFILREARATLSPDEYVTFKQTLDRVAPPKPKARRQQPAKTPQTKMPPAKTAATAEAGPELVIPTSAILPDGVVPPVVLR